jgi:hypothetical protein
MFPVTLASHVGCFYLEQAEKYGRGPGELWPIFSVVVYTGRVPWPAPLRLRDCFVRHEHIEEEWYPDLGYTLVDINQHDMAELSTLDCPAAWIVGLKWLVQSAPQRGVRE